MKRSLLILSILSLGIFFSANAQVSVRVNVGLQPVWGPVGYDYVDYYYLPDIEAYYYVPEHHFVYFEGGRWITAAALPPRFGHFDLYGAHKVVINEPSPWLHHDVYRTRYAEFRGRHDQVVIRDSHEPRYFEIKEHPEHNKWKGPEHHEEHREEHHGEHHEGHGR